MNFPKIILSFTFMLFLNVSMVCAQNTDGYAFQRAIEEYRNGNAASAIDWFEKEIKEHPNNGYAYLYLATLRYELDEYGKALTTINNALDKLPKKDKETGAAALGYKGDIMLALRDTVGALTVYGNAIKLNPDNTSLHINRGNVYYAQGNYPLADRDFQRVTELEPGEPVGYVGLARTAIARKDYSAAISLLDHAVRLDSENARSYAFRAEAYLGQKKWNEAVDDIIKALCINGDAKAHYLMINIPNEALYSMKARLQIQANKDSNDAAWYYYLGQLSQKKNRYRDAIKFYTKANERDANSLFLERIADCYFDLGDYAQALVYVDKALAIKPDDEDLYLLKGNIYNEMGNQSAAIEQIDKYIEMAPEFFYGYYRRGWFRDEQDDREGAIDDYTMAITLEPSYAYSYIGRGRDYERLGQHDAAIADYKKVIELDTVPEQGSCAHYAYFFLGQRDKAADFMQRYLDNPDEGDADGGNYDAACLYSLMGETDKALIYLREALKRGYRRFAHIEVDHDLDNIRNTQQFRDLIQEYKTIQERENIPADNESSLLIGASLSSRTAEVPFSKEQGVTKVKCTINELPLHFVFDTGAADVTISLVEANFMLKNGYIKPTDIIGSARYVNANGDISEGTTINLRHVNFGGLELENVRASVVRNQKAPLLLGQSVLGRLGRIEIDNNKSVLRITGVK